MRVCGQRAARRTSHAVTTEARAEDPRERGEVAFEQPHPDQQANAQLCLSGFHRCVSEA